ncbi:MAG: sensor domain-containing diguanylate cyclase [Legionella sp.]|nr:MAG: sensor domain-containing diguanylate cyclase [Legionella sp.]
MTTPEKPENEEERLEALRYLNILDTDSEERFDRITRIACKLFNVPIAQVSLIDSDRQWIKSTQGLDVKQADRKTSFCAHAILKDEMMMVEDASKDKRFVNNPYVIGESNVKFYLGCPIKVNNQNIGTLCILDDKVRRLRKTDMSMMKDLAEMVRLELESVHLSTTDELTGLSNRRGFLKIAQYVFKICQRDDISFTLINFDIDKFKQINDTFGHAEGDIVLKIFADCLSDCFRGSDVIARIENDEFCVLCSGLIEEDVDKVLERLQQSIHVNQSDKYKISYSVGHVQYNKNEHRTLHDLIKLADMKMHRDKNRPHE